MQRDTFPHNQLMHTHNKSAYVYLIKSLPRFYSARPSAFFLNTTGDNRIIPHSGKGRCTIKSLPTRICTCTCDGRQSRSVEREKNARPHPFMDYWFPISPIMVGAHSFFTPIHLLNAKRMLEFGGQDGWILHARRDLTRFFSFSPIFPFFFLLPFSSFALHIAGRIWFSSHIRIGNRRQLRRGWFYGVFGAKRT